LIIKRINLEDPFNGKRLTQKLVLDFCPVLRVEIAISESHDENSEEAVACERQEEAIGLQLEKGLVFE
jgi:hypothetical protein